MRRSESIARVRQRDRRRDAASTRRAGVAYARAFAPGRVCVIGEHTDYNDGLALALAIAAGRDRGGAAHRARRRRRRSACARTRSTSASTTSSRSPTRRRARGLARVRARHGRGAGARRAATGRREPEIRGDVPRGAGMSSSAALEIALALALLALAGTEERDRPHRPRQAGLARGERVGGRAHRPARPARLALRRAARQALRIDFQTLSVQAGAAAPRTAGGWSRSTRASGARTPAPATTSAARSARGRASCWACARCAMRACEAVERLPRAAARRARHVLSDNARVDGAVGGAARRRSACRWRDC